MPFQEDERVRAHNPGYCTNETKGSKENENWIRLQERAFGFGVAINSLIQRWMAVISKSNWSKVREDLRTMSQATVVGFGFD